MEADENIIVEVLDSTQIPISELSEFTETKPIKIEEFKQESQEILIKKYVSGEMSFPTFYTTLEAGDDDEDADTVDPTNLIQNNVLQQFKQPVAETSRYMNIDHDSLQKKDKRQGNVSGGNSGGGRRRSILNPALQGLMGEANLRFARGQNDMTEKICLEIIRQNPLAPEPFFTLAQIYETKDIEKFLNFLTIAAHLDPGNRDQWIRIAEMNIEKKNYHQARVLYSKAIKHLPKDYDIRLKKAKLLEIMGEQRDAMLTYLKMIPNVPIEKGELCLVTAKNVAKYFYEQKKMLHALEAMRSAYAIVPHLFTSEEINLFLELLMLNKNYDQVLTILRDQCNVELEIEQDGNEIIVIAIQIPDNLIVEFRVKLCVSLIHCKAYDLINYIINNITEKILPIEDGINFYMDIVEALMKEEKYYEALKLTDPIIKNDISPPPYVWLRNAECYRSIGLIENAIESYYQVVELAPFCYDAKFTLSALLKQQGRHREAIKALEQDMDGDSINPRLLYECCLMLKTINDIDQYIDIGYLLLARKSLKFRSREEIIACSNGGNSFNPETYKSIVETRFDKDIDDEPEYNETEANLNIDDEYELFKDIAETTYCIKKFGILQKLCFAMATSKRFRGKYREMEKIIMLASLYNNDPLIAFYFFREILAKNIDNNAYWNFMNVIIQAGDETRYHRFLKRIFERHSCPSYLKILLANYHLIAGSYKYALNFYVPIFKESSDPLACLCIGICFTQISLQKNSLKKPTGIAQAIAFCKKYSELRMSSETKQEIYYNLGRMHHQSGVIHLALHYYEKALEIDDEIVKENLNILGLREEIAFNIHLIYKACGNIEMARKYLYKYIVV